MVGKTSRKQDFNEGREENLRPVRAFLKICSKPRNFRLRRLLADYCEPMCKATSTGGNSHGQIDSGVEAQTAFVGAQGRVELHTVAAVDLQLAFIILPDDTELQHALGDGDDLEGNAVLGVLLEEGAVLEGANQLWMKLLADACSDQSTTVLPPSGCPACGVFRVLLICPFVRLFCPLPRFCIFTVFYDVFLAAYLLSHVPHLDSYLIPSSYPPVGQLSGQLKAAPLARTYRCRPAGTQARWEGWTFLRLEGGEGRR